MENRRWAQWDRWMRAAHLYTGLFLTPWMVVYAVSAFCLNHQEWFTETLHLVPKPKWEVVREVPFAADPATTQVPEDQAKAILEHLDLDGPFRLQDPPDAKAMILYRFCITGNYRITWHRERSQVVVEKWGPFSFYTLVNALHFQHGYGQPYFANVAWAIVVDAVTASTVLWIVSGIYLWARRPRKRLLGGLCLILGTLLFLGLAIVLCS